MTQNMMYTINFPTFATTSAYWMVKNYKLQLLGLIKNKKRIKHLLKFIRLI